MICFISIANYGHGNNGVEVVDVPEDNIAENQSYFILKWFLTIFLWWQAAYNISSAAAELILRLFSGLLRLIAHPIQAVFPNTLYVAKKCVAHNLHSETLEYLIVCPLDTCNAIYTMADATEVVNGNEIGRKCSAIHYGKQCQEPLLYSKRLSNNKSKLMPYKIFPINRPTSWLKEVIQLKEFRQLINQQYDKGPSLLMTDVCDGSVWREFADYLGHKFNLALMMFVDWVRPYKRAQYSIGTIYVCILNLPRAERLKKKWIHVIGIIPGPSEPKIHMNTYLKPIVDDLIQLWEGIEVTVSETGQKVKVRAALLCLSCDIPAIRKVSQFLSFTANKGCNMCKFMAEREKDDNGHTTGRMSYFSRRFDFELRTKEEVIMQGREFLHARNKTAAAEIAKKNGVRFSELHRLPYFNPAQMCAVDPMHALLLGLVKKEVMFLLETGENNPAIMSQRAVNTFQKRLKSIEMPSDCGRLPNSILEKSSVDGFTAQQWLLFALVYARPCFYDLIPRDHYKCLVLLCEIIEECYKCQIGQEEIAVLEEKVRSHHKMYEKLYGKWAVSINNHMVLHLCETIQRYGPCHSFWCFAAERMNGMLTGLPNSGRSVEKELFNRFSAQQHITIERSFQNLPRDLIEKIEETCPIISRITEETDETDIAQQLVRMSAEAFASAAGRQEDAAFEKQHAIERGESEYPFKKPVMLSPQRADLIMNVDMYNRVMEHLRDIFDDRLVHLSVTFSKFARCRVNGMLLTSLMNRSERSSNCLAYWAVNESEQPQPYHCKIEFFFDVHVVIKSRGHEEIGRTLPLAYVSWHKPSSNRVTMRRQTGLACVQNSFYQGFNIISVNRLVKRVVPIKVSSLILISNLYS